MKKNGLLFLTTILLLTFLHGCENEKEAPANLEFSISPDTLLINDQDTVRQLFISTKPSWKCDFKITQVPTWLSISPLDGQIDGKITTLTIRPKKTGLVNGKYSGDISIISDIAGSAKINVSMTIGEIAPAHLEFIVSPDTLIISDQDTVKEVFISTKPIWNCDFRVTQKPSWLTVTPSVGKIDGSATKLIVRPRRTWLSEGKYSGNISIISDIAGSTKINVSMTVGRHPKISTDLSSLNFPQNVNEVPLTIQDIGSGPLTWSLSNFPAWLSFSSSSGTLSSGSSMTIMVKCNRAGMDANTYSGNITIESNSENTLQPIPVSMQVPAITAIEVPTNIVFYEFTEKRNIVLVNKGNAAISWSAVPGDYLTLNTTSGNLGKGESQTIEATVNRTSFQTGTYESSITFNYGSVAPKTIPVQIKHFIQAKWGIQGTVKDAEFCGKTNRIILVTTNPDRLLIIDPDTKTFDAINLHSTPKCVSINKNGDKAVVGHNGMITFIDIAGKTIEKESSVGCDVLDIVLTSTGWVYAFPARDQWVKIICINPLTGVSTQHTGTSIYAGSLGKLHPSEKWIYATLNLSPSDIIKLDVESGTAVYSYDSPYHGDYPINGNLWCSADGQRIFTQGRTVLRSSSDKASDMLYNGSMPCTSDIWTLFHSASTDKVYYATYVRGTGLNEIVPASEISVCNYTYLTFIKSYKLENFIVPDSNLGSRSCKAEGHYVFTNEEGTKLYVIIKADKTSGLLNDWAIQSIDIN